MGHQPEQEGLYHNACPKPMPCPKKAPKPLKRTPLNRKPYQLKRTPLPRPKKPIRKQTENKARQKREVAQVVASMVETTPLVCKSCGRSDAPLDPSHLLPQDKCSVNAKNEKNIHFHCRYPCHDDCHNFRYYKMGDGMEIMCKLWQMGEKGRAHLRIGLARHDGLNMDLWKQSPFCEEYEMEINT